MANRVQRFMRDVLLGRDSSYNSFNEAFMSWIGGSGTNYDANGKTYIDKGYNLNSVVFSVINQQSRKISSIPYTVQKVKNNNSKNKYNSIVNTTKGDLSIQQLIKSQLLKNDAFDDEDLMMPLENPNPNQTWTEFHELYETFLGTNGNVYMYMLSPKDGMNAGEPIAIYLLPSQDTEIVLKDNVSFLGVENPISHYMLIQGKQYVDFDADDVIHIKTANPNYDEEGAHLYGQSRLRAGLRNVENSNKATTLNGKTLQNGGAFGFIHGTKVPLTKEQADEVKERLTEMNNSTEDLGKIQGMSGELGFTRVSLTTAELQPFEYLNYDQKQICNVLGWSDKLLNNDNASTFNNITEERKRVVTDTIHPDLKLLQDALNRDFLPRFKKYQNTEIIYSVNELPEMQKDTAELEKWSGSMVDKGSLNRDEQRVVMNFTPTGLPEHQVYTVANDVLTLEEAIESEFNIEPPVNG